MAFNPEQDKNLRSIPVGHLFGTGRSSILVRKNAYLRGYIYAFIEMISPNLNRKLVEKALLARDGNVRIVMVDWRYLAWFPGFLKSLDRKPETAYAIPERKERLSILPEAS